jgi:O-antigen chain-terminating methyltransferase
MQDDFYRAFEDKHRGSRELIKERLKVYLPFIEPFKQIYQSDDIKTLDLGCGRGEWLELLRDNDLEAFGVDLDENMLSACRERNLNVIHADALDFLKQTPDNSFIVVSGFHIAERLPFDVLKQLVKESLRVLKPAGLLILETPNPENISVGTVNFWIDPTHIRPLSPQLLSFLVEYHGFYRNKILRLQEPKELLNNKNISISDIFFNFSPDYSIVAQKEAQRENLILFDEVFSKNYGINLSYLTNLYDKNQESKLLQLYNLNLNWQQTISSLTDELKTLRLEYQEKENTYQSNVNQLSQTISSLTNELNSLKEEYQKKVQEVHYWWTVADSLKQQYSEICNTSWKITKPLRILGKFARWFARGSIAWITLAPQSRPRRTIRQALVKAKHYVATKLVLKSGLKIVLKPFPGLYNRLKRVGLSEIDYAKTQFTNKDINFQNLSPRAKKIYQILKEEIERKRN